MSPSISLPGWILGFTLVLAFRRGHTQLEKAGFCRVSQADARVIPGNFTREQTEGFSTTAEASGGAVPLAERVANCTVLSYASSFDALLGSDWELTQLGPTMSYNYAQEAPVLLPESGEVFFTAFTGRAPDGDSNGLQSEAEAWLLDLESGAVREVNFTEPIGSPLNGATSYRGQIALSPKGGVSNGFPAGILQLNPYTGDWSWIVNNWFGLRFYSVNDLVALDDDTLIFTNFNFTRPGVVKQTALGVWALPPTGPARLLIDDLPATPNGVALTPDNKTLYVTTTAGEDLGLDAYVRGNKIYAFDLVVRNGGVFAQNKRVFAAIDDGIPDGLKVDRAGNVWTSAGDGVQVFNAGGQLIGKILVSQSYPKNQAVNNLIFAGNRLVILHHTDVLVLRTNTSSVGSA